MESERKRNVLVFFEGKHVCTVKCYDAWIEGNLFVFYGKHKELIASFPINSYSFVDENCCIRLIEIPK